jgi:hypothetical protein
MRPILSLPISLLVGFGVGFVWFRESAPPRVLPLAQEAPVPGAHIDAAAPIESSEPTEVKTKRISAAISRREQNLERGNELYLAIQALTADDFRNLLGDSGAWKEIVEKLSRVSPYPPYSADTIANALISRWLTVDPDMGTWAPRALALIQVGGQMNSGDVRGQRLRILDALSKKRPEDVLKLISAGKDADERRDLISSGLRELAAQSPAKASAWLESCTDEKDRAIAEKAIRAGLVQADPLRVVDLTANISDHGELGSLWYAARLKAMKMGPETGRQLAHAPKPVWLSAEVLAWFAQYDPDAAVDLAAKQPLEGNETSWMEMTFAQLAARDHSLACEKVQSLTGATRVAAIAGIAAEWGGSEPAAALDWVASFPAPERKKTAVLPGQETDVLLTAFKSWTTADPAAAGRWAEALPPGETRDQVQAQRARALSTLGDLPGAARVLSTLNPPDPKALSEVACQWTQRDPQAAADWAIAQPSSPLQTQALISVVTTWANDDPQRVADWVAQFPPGDARDRSVMAFLSRDDSWGANNRQVLADFDKWFDLIGDPWQRAKLAQRAYEMRKRTDPAGARSWLSSLPNVDLELIRKALRQTN